MSSLTSFNGVSIVTPTPTGDGGLALNNNFKVLSTYQLSRDPLSSDNSGVGLGTRWFNPATNTEFICTSVTPGTSATWVRVTNLAAYAALSGATFTGVLTIADPSDAVGFILKGSTSQTANLAEYRNHSNTMLAAVGSDGTFKSPTLLVDDLSGYTDVAYQVRTATLLTADSTPTTIASVNIADYSTSAWFTIRLLGAATVGIYAYFEQRLHVLWDYTNSDYTINVVGTSIADTHSFTGSFSAVMSGSTLNLQVTGMADTGVHWRMTYEWQASFDGLPT